MKKTYAWERMAFTLLVLLAGCIGDRGKGEGESVKLTEDEASINALSINASQYGVGYPETFVLMQNRMGVRIEYCIDRSNLQLWLSPQAGKSFSYADRNWSNRDDHTCIFDRILIPGLALQDFDSCQWDPFHSILYFKDQTMHMAQVYDQPMVLVWFEKPGAIDLKIYGEAIRRSETVFTVNHADRGRNFQSTAMISAGEGIFRHQLALDRGRSTHARANLLNGQYLLIGSELEQENISRQASQLVEHTNEEILARNEELIAKDLAAGKFRLRHHHEMQKLLDKSRRVALSMQDFNGFMRSTNQYIYYLLWYRDGGMNTSHIGYSGWTRPAYDQARFSLLNPNISYEEPGGHFFGQVMGGSITKWQEDGLFYVLWPAFTYWTQTGDEELISGKYLETLQHAMSWLEDYCFDEQEGLFGRYHACETPLVNARGYGWDNATGAPSDEWDVLYKGHRIIRSYDLYINLLNYASYLMLAAMCGDDAGEEYYRKARKLEANMMAFFENENPLPAYGRLLTEEGNMVMAGPYGLDIWDYVWGLSLPPFTPTLPDKYRILREQVVRDMIGTDERYFICVYNAMLTSMDPAIHDEKMIMQALEKLVPQSVRPGKYLPMPYAVPELINIEDGEPFHDVRPLVYSIAPWLSAITNLGLRRLPFGIAIRPSNYLEKIENYEYLDGWFDIHYEGSGILQEISLNGQALEGTLQIPSSRILHGKNRVIVRMGENPGKKDLMISSTVRLEDIAVDGLHILAYGKNVLVFKDLESGIGIQDGAGNRMAFDQTIMDRLTYIEFEGRGKFWVSLNP